jgi:hypothetical protein
MPYFQFEDQITPEQYIDECTESDIEKLKKILNEKYRFNINKFFGIKSINDEFKLEILLKIYKQKTLEELQEIEKQLSLK